MHDSSLVYAKVLPALRSTSWRFQVLVVRPGKEAVRSLSALLEAADQPESTARWLVYVDQLEEVFAAGHRELQEELFALLAACWNRPACCVLLSMRADFYSDLMLSAVWDELKEQRFEIAPLRGASLREAIVPPSAELDKRCVDLAHDALIGGWSTLSGWVEEQISDLRLQAGFELRAKGSGLRVTKENGMGVRGSDVYLVVGAMIIVSSRYSQIRGSIDLRVYRDVNQVVAQCPRGPYCLEGGTARQRIEYVFTSPGTYRVVLLSKDIGAALTMPMDDLLRLARDNREVHTATHMPIEVR